MILIDEVQVFTAPSLILADTVTVVESLLHPFQCVLIFILA